MGGDSRDGPPPSAVLSLMGVTGQEGGVGWGVGRCAGVERQVLWAGDGPHAETHADSCSHAAAAMEPGPSTDLATMHAGSACPPPFQ